MTFRLAVLVSAMVSVTVACGAGNGTRPATRRRGTEGSVPATAASSDPANEICATMVRDAIAQLVPAAPLLGAPTLAKTGDRTTCTYRFSPSGTLTLTVDEPATNQAAVAVYHEREAQAVSPQPADGLGSAAFVTQGGSTVMVKDNKVLAVDVSQLPPGVDRRQVSGSLAAQIAACWTG